MLKNIIITDVGSTTTKALLIQKQNNGYRISNLQNASTTVERPEEDVRIGVVKAIQKMEENSKCQFIQFDKERLEFLEETTYITTSSAGGGLQILVIGLTKFDTASSAERAAFGAGGVILDTFAIDDKRSALEQMEAMRNLQPDIILMAGGVEGGALVPILRLAEIVQIAEPTAKFSPTDKIPFIFAGNSSARPYLQKLVEEKFDWHPVANIRPTMQKEDLKEAREKIHELFMNNVMERAPGYSFLKKLVADPIVPTPTGVMRTLQVLNEAKRKNVIMVDIGGATTDIFSNIFGQFFRTVSANYGMSYSIANVMKDVSIKSIQRWVQPNISADYIQNYIANKMLYPTYNPTAECELMIEQAVGREAIRLSKQQHLAMNFNKKQIGFLERLKKNDMEKIVEAFYFEKKLEKERFHMHDFDIAIGAGGLLSHTKNKMQALSIIMEGFQTEGITEIWRDNHFISPHLGKLSELDKDIAEKLITEQCFEILGLVIRPVTRRWKENKPLLSYKVFSESKLLKETTLKFGEMTCESNPEKKELEIEINLAKKVYLTSDKRQKYKLKTKYPFVFDGRIKPDYEQMNSQLQLFSPIELLPTLEDAFIKKRKQPIIKTGKHFQEEDLPYEGEIFVKPNEQVTPETIIGENRFAPPKIFFISLFDKSYLGLNPDNIRDFLQVKEGDEVNYGTKIVDKGKYTFMDEMKGRVKHYNSPVRGKVKTIHYEAGTILLKEIQDYQTKPVQIKVSDILHVKPEEIARYIKRKEGDFIYGGELLASRIWDIKGENVQSNITNVDYMRRVVNDALSQSQKIPITIPSPTTGKVKKIDLETGKVTIHYDEKPYRKKAFLYGAINEVKRNKTVKIEFEGTVTQGIIGFGREAGGILQTVQKAKDLQQTSQGKIIVLNEKITYSILQKLKKLQICGLIAGSIDYDDLRKWCGEDIGVALTGNENIPFPVILTEGFGHFEIHKDLWSLFSNNAGNWCYVNGHTQIRAGVVRPKIVLQKLKKNN